MKLCVNTFQMHDMFFKLKFHGKQLYRYGKKNPKYFLIWTSLLFVLLVLRFNDTQITRSNFGVNGASIYLIARHIIQHRQSRCVPVELQRQHHFSSNNDRTSAPPRFTSCDVPQDSLLLACCRSSPPTNPFHALPTMWSVQKYRHTHSRRVCGR